MTNPLETCPLETSALETCPLETRPPPNSAPGTATPGIAAPGIAAPGTATFGIAAPATAGFATAASATSTLDASPSASVPAALDVTLLQQPSPEPLLPGNAPDSTSTDAPPSHAVASTEDWQAQAALLQRFLLVQPDHLDALQMLGVLHGTHGNPLAAADCFGRACPLSPHDSALRLNLARALHESGQHALALAQYEQLIAQGEADAATWTDRGTVLRKLGRPQEALESYGRALAMAPPHAAAWINQGNLLHELGRFTEALAFHDIALALLPESPTTLSNMAATLEKLERLEAALGCLNQALALDPENPVPWSSAGVVLRKLKRFDASLAHHDRAIALQSYAVSGWTNRALTLNEMQRFDEALESHDRAVQLDPDQPEAWLHRGVTLNHLERHAEAADHYTQAIALQPDFGQAWMNRAISKIHDGRHADALADFDRAFELLPNEPSILVERATALYTLARAQAGNRVAHHADTSTTAGPLHRYERAVEDFGSALAMNDSLAQTWMNRAVVLAELNRVDDALADLARAVQIAPDCPDAHFNAGLLHLSRGDYEAGWQGHEYRFSGMDPQAELHTDLPRWDGKESLTGKRLLVWAEQGYGDMLQFCRYVPIVAARHAGAEVLFEVPPSLASLCATLPGCRVIVQGDPALAADWQIPLMSLPLALGGTDIPASAHYLTADPALVREWRERLGPAPSGLRIGIACSGNPRHKGNAVRSIPLALMAPLQRYGTLYLLQNQLLDEDRARLATQPAISDVGSKLADFSATAAVVANMDLVISVDTSIAHLAGALGKQVWVVLPWVADWRWLRERGDSPWYPTARLFRNPELEGWRVLDGLEKALSGLVAS
ncbi:MAG: tetratricopeptide repeat family protein [Herminiimonas sp.]|nr:tetratricopeptide repeat family protein [Herminiimonas sp.]